MPVEVSEQKTDYLLEVLQDDDLPRRQCRCCRYRCSDEGFELCFMMFNASISIAALCFVILGAILQQWLTMLLQASLCGLNLMYTHRAWTQLSARRR